MDMCYSSGCSRMPPGAAGVVPLAAGEAKALSILAQLSPNRAQGLFYVRHFRVESGLVAFFGLQDFQVGGFPVQLCGFAGWQKLVLI